jgi:hypothetical protein
VRKTCEEFGLEYRDYRGFWIAMGHCVGYLHELGRPVSESEAEGEPAAAQ